MKITFTIFYLLFQSLLAIKLNGFFGKWKKQKKRFKLRKEARQRSCKKFKSHNATTCCFNVLSKKDGGITRPV